MKKIFLIINTFFLSTMCISAQHPTNQPDADGKIIKGRSESHHWQSYMTNANLSDYHHAPEQSIEEFNDLKYGLRIHWGIYSIVNGNESWVITDQKSNSLEYQGFYHDLYKSWYPYAFDANQWADMMQKNGFKFFVFTTKHHDGFSMYDTKTIIKKRFSFFGKKEGEIEPCSLHYSIMETPFKRDITKELIKSARSKGLKIGLYFSHPDWYDADFRFDEWNPQLDNSFSPKKNNDDWENFKTRHRDQIKEILINFGQIDMLSFDMWLPEFAWDHMQEMARMARKIQPNCMLRWRGIGNYGDYHTPENYIPGDESQGTMAWQVIHTLSTRNKFSWEPDERYIRSGDWIVSNLIDIVSKGGNLMIGAGPDLTGSWHPKVLESLEYASKWLKINGEAIYKTRPCKINREGDVYYTRNKENTITYALIDSWPGSSLFVDHIQPNRNSKIYLLGFNKPLSWKRKKRGVVIELPIELQLEKNRPCVQAYVFKIVGTQI